MASFGIPEPLVKLELSGTNYGRWAWMTKITLQAQGLWEHITGERACPPFPAPPPHPPATADKEVTDAANTAYLSALDAYRQWLSDDARAMLILTHSVEDDINHLELQSAQEMWAHLQRHYQRVVDAVHYSLLQQLQTLKQDGDTVDAFYVRFMSLWNRLDSLIPILDVCGKCACCTNRKQHNDKRCLYEFLIRLRPEFGPAKDQLLRSSPLPSVIEARNALLAEEFWLQRAAPVVVPAEKKKKKKKRSGGRANLSSSSSPLPQNEVAQMVNQFQGLTFQWSSWSTNLPQSRYSHS